MKLRLLDIIVCPNCKKSFKMESSKQETLSYSADWKSRIIKLYQVLTNTQNNINTESIWKSYCTNIITGKLVCEKCGNVYPIENGIPRILDDDLRTLTGGMGRSNPLIDPRVKNFMDQASPVNISDDAKLFNEIQKANQSNYGYEWKAFSHEYSGWETVYKKYYVFEDDSFFKDKLGLDAGCGMGRYSLVPVSKGAEVVGVDLSNAIEAAYMKSLHIPAFHTVQGDIYNLPFRDDQFDFAQTLGVIHIAPDPEEALLSIKKKLRNEGKLFIYVYPDFRNENKVKYNLLKLVKPLRKITVKIPSNCLYWLLYLVLPIVLFLLYYPSKILWHIPGMRKLSAVPPYNYDQYRGRKIRDIHMNLFDRFGNPVERRYSHDEMKEWMNSADFKEYSLHFKDGWTVSAVK